MLYYAELFDHSNKVGGKTEKYFLKTVIPYLKKVGYESHFFSTQYGLGPREFWLVTKVEEAGHFDLWEKLSCEPEGQEILRDIEKFTTNKCRYVMKDLEPKVNWIREPGKMYHMESFKSIALPGRLEKFFLDRALPYLRGRGFGLKLFKNQYGLGVGEFWFVTEMDSFSSIDNWPDMVGGEPEGTAVMEELLSIIDIPKASIIKECLVTD